MSKNVRIDKVLCLSSGHCVLNEPDAFVFDDDQLAEPTAEVSKVEISRLEQIVESCPGGAISFVGETQGERAVK